MSTMVIAPHPDDEVLGVGGTILRRKAEGKRVAWLVVTCLDSEGAWSDDRIKQRGEEINRISKIFDFDEVFELNFPTMQLDKVPMSELVNGISKAFKNFEPEELFVSHPSDIHTEHRVVFDAVASCTKWFRYPLVKRVLAYETLSETDFGLGVYNSFRPNVYIDIESYLTGKLDAMNIYASELDEFPFPRSHEAIKALAHLRGTASGFMAAEAFELLRERQ